MERNTYKEAGITNVCSGCGSDKNPEKLSYPFGEEEEAFCPYCMRLQQEEGNDNLIG